MLVIGNGSSSSHLNDTEISQISNGLLLMDVPVRLKKKIYD